MDTHDYAGVQSYLESLTFVSRVSVQGLSGDTVRFRLTTRGGIEPLQHAIALSGGAAAPARGATMEFSAFSSIADRDLMRRWLRQLPNIISSIRIALVVPSPGARASSPPRHALAVRGGSRLRRPRRLSRQALRLQSEFGGVLDPVADK